jgi:CDP-archaeol synthase
MTSLHIWPIFQCLILLTIANGVPVIAKKISGEWLAWPIDGGWILWDGQPLLGRSKTFRGVALAVIASAVAAPLVGLDIGIGALVGLSAMAGDMLSSFVKRRLRLASSAEAPGLDQVPESLLQMLAVKGLLGLSALDILVAVGSFWIGELLVSRLLFMLRVIHPSTRPHCPRKIRIQRDWNSAGQTNLAAMRVARQQQIEAGMSGLAINLRSMGEQD